MREQMKYPIVPPPEPVKMKYRFVFYIRPASWMLRKDWYSLARWGVPGLYSQERIWLVDIGSITVGLAHDIVWR